MFPNTIRARAALTFLVTLALGGCFTAQVPPVAEYPAVQNQSIFLVKKIGYDRYGRPEFNDRLNRRPGSAGDTFAVVHAVNGRPLRSYSIAVVPSNADLTRPFAVIYDWTGRGFEGGVAISSGIFPQGTIQSGEEAAVYLAIKAAPIVIATVTGFVVGVLASIPKTAVELKNIVVNARETITGYTEYSYDERSRIKFMKLYPPGEHVDELVRADFLYEGGGQAPVRTIVMSVAERKIRTIP